MTNTVTQLPAATKTVVKEGEVPRNGAAAKVSALMTFCLPYTYAWVLICVAVLMGMM